MTFQERAKERAQWPIRIVRLGEEEAVDPRDATTVDERVRLVATLTREQWQIAARPIPSYSRAEMPGRVIRRGG